MPTLKEASDKTGLPRHKRWDGFFGDVKGAVDKANAPAEATDAPTADHPPIRDLLWNLDLLWDISFQKCLSALQRWHDGLPDSHKRAADVILEKRLRPTYQLPPAPKPSLVPSDSDVRTDLQARVVAEGVAVMGSAEKQGTYIQDVFNASHFSNDPGSWSVSADSEEEYRAVPRALLLEILDAYPRAGKANSRTEAVIDCISWLYAHGVTAAGQVNGRGRYVAAVVQNEGTGEFDVVCYDPHNYQRVLDPNFRATPEEVHSGKYPAYREGPYDTRYGGVWL